MIDHSTNPSILIVEAVGGWESNRVVAGHLKALRLHADRRDALS
jgi:hypothetical protein